MSANETEILLRLRDEFTARLNAASKSLDDLAAKTRTVATASEQSMKRTAQAITEAGIAARGLGREIGITIPESLSRAAARSEIVGPLLTKAFNVVAIIGFIQVLKQLPDAIREVSGAVTGWDDAAQKAYASQLSLNGQYIDRLKMTQAELEKTAIAAQKAATAAAPNIGQRIIPRLPGGVLSGLFNMLPESAASVEARRLQDIANAAGKAASANMGAPGQLRPELQAIVDIHEKLAEAARKAREETEKLYEGIRRFVSDQRLALPGGPGSLRGTFGQTLFNLPDMTQDFPTAGIDFGAAVGNMQAAKDRAREFANSQAEIVADAQLKAAQQTFEKQKRMGEDLARSLSNSLGAVWDDMFIRGRSVFSSIGNFFAGIGNAAGRSVFQSAGTRLAGGVLGRVGLGGILGLGSASSALGSTAVAGLAGGPALGFGLAGTAAPMAIGGVGAGAGVGASSASILGLSLSTAIPIFGAIAGAGILAFMKLRHTTQEAPFATDAFQEKTRVYEFYAADRQLEATRELSKAIRHLKSMPPKQVVTVGLTEAINQDDRWRARSGAALMGEDT
jgi:hypothetical protein